MSTYTELASIINSTDSINYPCIERHYSSRISIWFSKTSYLVQDHVKYIKRIQTAKSPVSYVKFVARKLFPDNAAYTAKIAKIRESYKNKQALLDKLEALFELYYNVTKDSLTGPQSELPLPVEIVERIVTKIPDTDLIAASKVDRVWWQEVRREAYKRWKNYATTIRDVYCEIRALGKHYIKREIDWDNMGSDPWGLGVV
ncbi:hypothetical protein GLOIN_2v1482873 [Rhizophagus irregularis DAOM 181602=DAOM 197198]|nr:hypothetical protein GLOIN_2v1482873 [Rhizophagus irregularis DAOM 181602=DAOM 197198]